MRYKEKHQLSKVYVTLIIVLILLYVGACVGQRPTQNQVTTEPDSYKILKDDMGFTIRVGVGSEIDEQKLRATLVKVADDHQNDAARDYLVSDHLWIDAYLMLGEKLSTIPAGRIGRYVPPRNPEAKDEDPSTEKEDQFIITLEAARKTLQ
jgi:hypothetical protein